MLQFRFAPAAACALLLLLPAALTAPRGGGPTCAAAAAGGDDYGSALFFAVLEGLYRDGVSDEAVDALLLTNDADGFALFVPGCPICTPALNALRVYRARPDFVGYKMPSDSFGPGLPADVEAACRGMNVEARFKALNGLIEGYVARYLAAQRLTPEEAAAWRIAMEDGRKRGMAGLTAQQVGGKDSSFKSCAVCDAANGACGLR